MAVALSEMKEAQRYAATQTEEGLEISLRHISNADFYMKKINELLVLSHEDADPDQPSA